MNFRQQLFLAALLTLPGAHSAPIVVNAKVKHDGSMPHCTKTAIVHEELSRANKDQFLQSVIELKLGLYETACFRLAQSNVSSTSLLYTVGLSAVEQHYPITQHYQFAVPLITSSCKCDCSGGDDHCNPDEYNYNNCKSSQSSLCYRSYHPNQASVGCPLGETSELCCDISFTPYKDWRFSAVKIEEPQTFAIFNYRAYDWNNGDWQIVEEDEIRMRLDGGKQSADLSKETGINIKVLGTAHTNKLPSGMYFMRDGEDELRFDVQVNPLHGSRLDELGWFRLGSDGEYKVQNDNLQMNNLHSVKVMNCKEQKYNSSFNIVQQFVTPAGDNEKESFKENFNLGSIVSYSKPWIANLRVETRDETRNVIVSHRESNSIDVTLSVKSDESLQFVHNSSAVADFSGSIVLDSKSNRFLNLTLSDASGILHGSCYVSDGKEVNEFSFSVYVSSVGLSDASTIVPLPSNIDSNRYICLKADDSDKDEICHLLDFNSEPLPMDLSKVDWQQATGHCPGCNEITLSSLLHFLDPRKWLEGVNSFSELSSLLMKTGISLTVVLAVFAIIKNCILPIIRLLLCPISTIAKKI